MYEIYMYTYMMRYNPVLYQETKKKNEIFYDLLISRIKQKYFPYLYSLYIRLLSTRVFYTFLFYKYRCTNFHDLLIDTIRFN